MAEADDAESRSALVEHDTAEVARLYGRNDHDDRQIARPSPQHDPGVLAFSGQSASGEARQHNGNVYNSEGPALLT
jgi:hypothetical protein